MTGRKFLIAVAVSTVALLVWGMVFWGSLYDPLGVFGTLLPDQEEVASLLQSGGGRPPVPLFVPLLERTAGEAPRGTSRGLAR